MRNGILAWLIPFLMFAQQSLAADAPDQLAVEPIRAFHFVLRGVPLDRAHWMVDEARRAGLNAVVVQLADGVDLHHAPWGFKPGAWSRDEFKAWVTYARSNGVQVIPELKLLTHQEKFLHNASPALMFNSSTYDASNPEVYQKYVYPLIAEIIELIAPRAFHIGHDEVAGHNESSRKKWLKPGERMLPAEMFYQDVIRLHEYISRLGVQTWMWGDMMISPDEFPGMRPNSLHGRATAYGKVLRSRLPKDIVICDWHYADDQADFPSLETFKADGFHVLGATWKKPKTIRNFSRYAAAYGADGMIATTWAHVQRKEWDMVARIIRDSGEAFSKDFPDMAR